RAQPAAAESPGAPGRGRSGAQAGRGRRATPGPPPLAGRVVLGKAQQKKAAGNRRSPRCFLLFYRCSLLNGQSQLSRSRHLATVSSTISSDAPGSSEICSRRLAISSHSVPFSTASHVPRTYLYSTVAPSSRSSVIVQCVGSTCDITIPAGSQFG